MINPNLFHNPLKMMKIKPLLIPVIGFSIVALLILQQEDAPQNVISEPVAGMIKMTSPKVEKLHEISAKLGTTPQQLPDEVLVEHIQIKPNTYDQLSIGDPFAIFIPQEQQEFNGIVEKSYQQFDGQIKVSTGPINQGQKFSSFTVTKGPELTLIMLATGDKIYQIEIDNATGKTTVIDDQALDYFRKDGDTLIPPPEGIS